MLDPRTLSEQRDRVIESCERRGVPVDLDDWDRIGRDVPCLLDLMPSGKHLMEDFFYAGGLPTIIKEIGDRIDREALTVNGKPLWENCADAEWHCRRGWRSRFSSACCSGSCASTKVWRRRC